MDKLDMALDDIAKESDQKSQSEERFVKISLKFRSSLFSVSGEGDAREAEAEAEAAAAEAEAAGGDLSAAMETLESWRYVNDQNLKYV